MTQAELNFAEASASEADTSAGPTLQERFDAFHAANPHVFEAFLAAARELKQLGRTRYGAKAIYERMRYHMALRTSDPDFKLNNNYTSRYARLLLAVYPLEFEGFLEVRRLKRD